MQNFVKAQLVLYQQNNKEICQAFDNFYSILLKDEYQRSYNPVRFLYTQITYDNTTMATQEEKLATKQILKTQLNLSQEQSDPLLLQAVAKLYNEKTCPELQLPNLTRFIYDFITKISTTSEELKQNLTAFLISLQQQNSQAFVLYNIKFFLNLDSELYQIFADKVFNSFDQIVPDFVNMYKSVVFMNKSLAFQEKQSEIQTLLQNGLKTASLATFVYGLNQFYQSFYEQQITPQWLIINLGIYQANQTFLNAIKLMGISHSQYIVELQNFISFNAEEANLQTRNTVSIAKEMKDQEQISHQCYNCQVKQTLEHQYSQFKLIQLIA